MIFFKKLLIIFMIFFALFLYPADPHRNLTKRIFHRKCRFFFHISNPIDVLLCVTDDLCCLSGYVTPF